MTNAGDPITKEVVPTTSASGSITGDVVSMRVVPVTDIGCLVTRDVVPTTIVTRATISGASSNGLVTGPLALVASVVEPLILLPFKRYVEIGRVALVNYGEDYGKLVVIVDVIDQNRALVDAPDMERSQMNFKRLSLTDIKIDIKRVPKKKELLDAMEKADVKKKWESSSWGRKLIVQKRRQNLTDFDRFKLMLAKIKRAGLVKQELAKLKKENAA
ncbi:hypothetical protein SO802_026768 [Lithocarpus litseifolius]|uniref:Large ribosomal subunit protein eL14 domain-containing protein n=1 Tax=Lithocarpus litseifolius TaxID=425828 RepID=A0AAW2C249_9ROSI